jgi:hypothetical protein
VLSIRVSGFELEVLDRVPVDLLSGLRLAGTA